MIADFATLQMLSGYKRPSDVKSWLKASGVSFLVQASGTPVTTLDAINRALNGGGVQREPDFSPPRKRSR
jgi:hypothetical protein